MISATVEAGDSSTSYLSKKASELQKGIRIVGDRISGTLHHVDSFEEFNSSDPLEQEGNFLVLTLKPIDDATIKTKIGDSGKEVEVDDGYCIYRVKSTDQKIYVTTEKIDDEPKTRILSLDGLVLEGAEE